MVSQEAKLLGIADMLELLARCFSFPTPDIALAVSNGTLAKDVRACAYDAGLESEPLSSAIDEIEAYRGVDHEDIYSEMKKGFSELFLVPGLRVPVFPYEGAFLYVKNEQPGVPSLFRNHAANDLLHMMRKMGLEPEKDRCEPADSVWFELAFFSHLYGVLFCSSRDNLRVDQTLSILSEFVNNHAALWLEDFMDQVQRKAPACAYAKLYPLFALIGSAVLPVALCAYGALEG